MILWIVLGVVLILGIFLAAQHMLGTSTRQETAAAYLGTRAISIVESSMDETTYRVFGEANGLTQRRDLGEALRIFIPSWMDRSGSKPAKTKDRDGYLKRFEFKPAMTRESYKDSPDVEVHDTSYGIVEQEPLTGMTGIRTNENRGIVSVSSEVTVHLPALRLSLTRKGRQEFEYKTVILGIPYPFNRYTFFDRALSVDPLSATSTTPLVVASRPGAGGSQSADVLTSQPISTLSTDQAAASAVQTADCSRIRDRFYSYLCQYDKLRAKSSAGTLDPFPVLAMDPKATPASGEQEAGTSTQTTASTSATIPVTGPIYSTLGRMGDSQYGYRGYSVPAFWGESLLGGSPQEEMSDQLLLMARQMFRKASAREARELEKYYSVLEEDSWKARRTHSYPDLASFIQATSASGVLDLGGIYWIDGPVVLQHVYRGHAVIVCPDLEGIVVRKVTRDPSIDGHLTLVALRGDVRALGDPTEVHASLVAVHGTIRGFSRSRIYGTVYVSYLPADREEGPEIQRPIDSEWQPIAKTTDVPAPGLARRTRAFLVPQPIRREYGVLRGRSS